MAYKLTPFVQHSRKGKNTESKIRSVSENKRLTKKRTQGTLCNSSKIPCSLIVVVDRTPRLNSVNSSEFSL